MSRDVWEKHSTKRPVPNTKYQREDLCTTDKSVQYWEGFRCHQRLMRICRVLFITTASLSIQSDTRNKFQNTSLLRTLTKLCDHEIKVFVAWFNAPNAWVCCHFSNVSPQTLHLHKISQHITLKDSFNFAKILIGVEGMIKLRKGKWNIVRAQFLRLEVNSICASAMHCVFILLCYKMREWIKTVE